eukprot:TRINITY_DN12634_c2_g1_i1.p1 TRINITY_DN12634_c2_g1~~TRINITY_DN12634_c2_g1_i1.p1  ORF type:complete len:202 (-),score=40.30 TRINITY_DN12634_c2_g1_i1:148-753(-)
MAMRSNDASARRSRWPAAAVIVSVAAFLLMHNTPTGFVNGSIPREGLAAPIVPAEVAALVEAKRTCTAMRSGAPSKGARWVPLPHMRTIKSRRKEYKFDEDGGLYDIIKWPLLTQKACELLEKQNTYTFMVDRRANKPQIRAAIETIFNVKVRKVNTLIPSARYVTVNGMKIGRKAVYKKSYVRLEAGEYIDLFPDDPDEA